MNGQLMTIIEPDLTDRAAAVGWRVATLAIHCGVSVPTLERFFQEAKGQSPRAWLHAARMLRAGACLLAGRNVQETAGAVAYKSQHAFSLAFKLHYGYPPKEHRQRVLFPKTNGVLRQAGNGSPKSNPKPPDARRKSPKAQKPKSPKASRLQVTFDKIKSNLVLNYAPSTGWLQG